jgi:hypothetical protein
MALSLLPPDPGMVQLTAPLEARPIPRRARRRRQARHARAAALASVAHCDPQAVAWLRALLERGDRPGADA